MDQERVLAAALGLWARDLGECGVAAHARPVHPDSSRWYRSCAARAWLRILIATDAPLITRTVGLLERGDVHERAAGGADGLGHKQIVERHRVGGAGSAPRRSTAAAAASRS
jgi:hypothetical protein